MTGDHWLMVMIAFGVFFLTSVFWIAYGTYRADQLRQQHAREVEMLKSENLQASRMVAKTEMQARVLGATPVSRLIGGRDG